MSRSLPLLTLLLPIALMASDPPPLALSLTLPDLARTSRALVDGQGRGVLVQTAVEAWRKQLVQAAGVQGPWVTLAQRTSILRAALHVGPVTGGLPAIEAVAGLHVPAGQDPASMPGLRVERPGAWLLLGMSEHDLDLPERTPVESLGRPMDLALVANLEACGPLFGPYSRVPAAWGAKTVELIAGIEAGAVVESALVTGRSPFRAVDPLLLSGLPERTAAIVALGLDGKALAGCAGDLITAAGCDLTVVEAEMQGLYGAGPAALAAALDGTVVLAVLPGPGFVLSLPGSDILDKLVAARVRAEHFEQAEQVLAEARIHPVSLGGVAGIPVFIQRTAGRWLFASEAAHVASMASEDPGAMALDRFGSPAQDAVVLACWDWGGATPLIAAHVTPADGLGLGLLVKIVRELSVRVPSGSLSATSGTNGLQIQARNGPGAVLLAASTIADVGLPVLVRAYREAAQAEALTRMHQIVARAIAFSKEQQGHWPRDLDDLRAWAKDLSNDHFVVAGHSSIAMPFCYVPPFQGPADDQPVLVEDPACNFGSGSLVGYGDGRVVMVPGQAMWREALRLAALAQAGQRGIERGEWATLPKVF